MLQFMLKKNPKISAQDELLKVRLENIIEPGHELSRLAELIDWDSLEVALSLFYCPDNGRPGGSVRLMAGLCFLVAFLKSPEYLEKHDLATFAIKITRA